MAAPLLAALPVVGELVGGLLDSLSGREKAKAEQALAVIRAAETEAARQSAVNEAEAAHPSLFVAGWRPAVGWVCAAGLCYQFLLRPLLAWGAEACGLTVAPPPSLDDGILELVLAMLGMGGLRTLEKLKKRR